MKRLYIFTALLCICTLFAHAQHSLFDKYADEKGISSVYISKAMLSMMADSEVGGFNLKGIADKLESIQVLSSEKPTLMERLGKEAADNFTPKNGYESLVRVRDEGERTDIFLKKHRDGLNEFVVLTGEKMELTLVIITGRLTQQDVQGIMGK